MAKKGDERKKDYGKAYNRYLKLMEKNEEKGYVVSRLDKEDFIEAYGVEHRRAIREGDAKRSVIRIIARDSVEFTNADQNKIVKSMNKDAKLHGTAKITKDDLKSMDRKQLWEEYLKATNNDYDATIAFYNSIFE